MRVLVFDPSNRAPLYLAHFAAALSGLVPTIVIAPTRQEEQELGNGIQSYLRPWTQWCDGQLPSKVSTYLRAWITVLKLARKVDVIHIQWLAGLDRTALDLLFLRELRRRNPRVAYTVHNILPHGLEDLGAVRRRYIALYQTLPLLFVHSERTKRELAQALGVPDRKIVVIPHGPLFAVPEVRGPRSIRYAAAMIGNMAPYKGVDDAVEAFAMVKNLRPGTRFLLAGRFDPQYKARILSRGTELGLETDLEVVDRRLTNGEIVELHLRSGLIVLPYRAISQSGAALTAIGLGVPIVCYNVGGLPDVVVPNVNGVVVPVGNVRRLADGVLRVLSSLDSFIEGAQRVKTKFSWEDAARLAVQAYSRLITQC